MIWVLGLLIRVVGIGLKGGGCGVVRCRSVWLVVIAPSVTARTMARFFEYDMLEITGIRTNDLGHQKSFSLLQADTSPERS